MENLPREGRPGAGAYPNPTHKEDPPLRIGRHPKFSLAIAMTHRP